MKVKCPQTSRFEGDIVGCGAVFDAEPDAEGLIDCLECGVWFKASESEAVPTDGLVNPQNGATT